MADGGAKKASPKQSNLGLQAGIASISSHRLSERWLPTLLDREGLIR
jgi:hypothetical protein